jgi:hypothetical protein
MSDKLSRKLELFRKMRALIIKQAEVEARLAGSHMVEAEHRWTSPPGSPRSSLGRWSFAMARRPSVRPGSGQGCRWIWRQFRPDLGFAADR